MYDLLQLPDFTHLQFFLTCLVAFGGGVIRGYTGFAGALLLLPGFVLIMGPLPALNVVIISGMIGQLIILPNAIKRAQKNTVLSFGGGLFLGVYLGLNFLFQREITDITFFMGIFIMIATLILVSGWKYKGPINILTSCGFGSGIGFFAGFFGVPTGPLTGLFFLSLKEEETELNPTFVLRGKYQDVKSYADAIVAEKQYLDAILEFGEKHPQTAKAKARLDHAVARFESATQLTWPFKDEE